MGDPAFVRLSGGPGDLEAVRAVLDRAPGYARAIQGAPFDPEEADSVFRDLPPGAPGEAKRVYLIRADDSDVCVIESIVGYPAAGTLLLGLLLRDEPRQGRGYGGQSVRWLERHAREHEGCTRVRLGVVAANGSALGFWEAMGYERTGEVRPWARGSVESEVVAFEKALGADV